MDTAAVKTEFAVGDEFSTEGLVVTASYSDGKTKEVTDWTASGFDSTEAAESQTITISYTEDEETATATYTIVIKDESKVPENGNPPVKIEYQITYETQFGSVPSKKVEKGYKLTAADLPSLTQKGYVFEGWNKKVGDEITADTEITEYKDDETKHFSLDLSGTTIDEISELDNNIALNEIKFPNSLKTINRNAFKGCDKLTSN